MDTLQRLDHLRPHLARQQRQDVLAPHVVTHGLAFLGEQPVERVMINLGALELGPGVFEVVRGVDLADEVERKPPLALELAERLERAGREYAAEIPDHRLIHACPSTAAIK